MICQREREKMSMITPVGKEVFSYLEMIGVSRMEDLRYQDVEGMFADMCDTKGGQTDRRLLTTLQNLVGCARDLD